VVTRSAEGLGVYANGEYYPHGLSDIGNEGKGDDIGCGDAVFAAFIAIKEALKGMPMEAASEMASIIGAYQFSNPESNLANYFSDAVVSTK
jgi:sugar/nucleoside kinase (ribokinase family)